MRSLFLAAFFPLLAWAQSPMDSYRWYLNPNGQELLISIDDLHDEKIFASPSMNWGRQSVPSMMLKKDVLIAVIDGGIDIEHPELKDSIAYNEAECLEGNVIPPEGEDDRDGNGYSGDCAGWNFVLKNNRAEDLDGHGTHVTGIIHSALNGIRGSFKFLPLNVFAPGEGTGALEGVEPLPVRLTKAFEYALARKADVIHLSVGWPKSYMTPELEAVITKAVGQGVAIVAAAGNSSQRATIYPCQMDGVICVGALRANGEVARFSNWGSQVDIFAPGEKILSTIPHEVIPMHISRKGYDYKNGTSQAAPFISAAMAALRGSFPQDKIEALYSRLMVSADAPVGRSGLKGLFHIDRALSLAPAPFIFPELKGLHSVVIDSQGRFNLSIPFKNSWVKSTKSTAVRLLCDGVKIANPQGILKALTTGATQALSFNGQVAASDRELNCLLTTGTHVVPLKLKVQHKLKEAFRTHVVHQDTPIVIDTRLGARSRFFTVAAIKGHHPEPLYYVPGKEITIYHEDQPLGPMPLKEGCKFLRVWQLDLDNAGSNELMVESMCAETHLQYQFLNLALKEVFPAAKYQPELTILNYDDFTVSLQIGKPPVFRFLGNGFIPPTDSPWDTDDQAQDNHLYDLRPVKDGEEWKYEAILLENTAQWVKSLGLRFMPAYQIMHYMHGKLLVRLGQKTAWVDVATQTASWAQLDDLLLGGSQKQKLWGTNDFVLQSMLTPYDYRGYVIGGVRLRFQQTDRFDPFLDILGTQKNAQGYLTVLRSFQRLIYLQYDFQGKLVSRKESVVDRFDFLTAEDLMASVVNLAFESSMLQVVDGTKINTNYVDVAKDGSMKSYEIPRNCVTQQPVVIDGRATLPVFCTRSKTEFDMRFIEL